MNVMKMKTKETEKKIKEEVKSIEKLILLERLRKMYGTEEKEKKNICIVILKSIL